MEASAYINNIVKIIGLSQDAGSYALKLYEKTIKQGLNADNTKAALACASIYAWCLKNKSKTVLYEIESASFIESEHIKKAFGDIQSEIGI